MHVVIDSSVYRADPKRIKSAFRAFTRLAQGTKVQLHVPHYVKREFLSQQEAAIVDALKTVKKQAKVVLNTTSDHGLIAYAEDLIKEVVAKLDMVVTATTTEFGEWLQGCGAVDHALKAQHAQEVTDDYFTGAPPFRGIKNRNDIPDSFIWQSALDIVKKHGELHFVVNDDALHKTAAKHPSVKAYRTLDEFIDLPECQQALKELTTETIRENISRATQLLPSQEHILANSVEIDIVDALHGKRVRHRSIPDDNNEAIILMVGVPHELTFGFDDVEYYGDNDIGVPFTAHVECTLSYSIYKGDYHCIPEEEAASISIDELNDHYYDAEQDYVIRASGVVSLALDAEEIEKDDLTDSDIGDLIHDADHSLEIDDAAVSQSEEWDGA